jgi:predicted transposase/invertase (TIGR01784 family)
MVYSMADHLLDEGAKRGREEGTEQTRTAIAIAMLKDELPIDTVAKYIGLSEAEIEQLTESVSAST